MDGTAEGTGKFRGATGMLSIFVSFIPWIVYWVLCNVVNALGVVIPFTISLILMVPQIRKMNFNLMDLASVFYFSIATVGTFVFKLNIFVESSGFLGYSFLFLMALSSLVIKQPYTLQVSKRNYPEVYWKDKSFIAINNLITLVWAGIFFVNATIFLLLSMPFTIILSNLLIVLGIGFSLVLPLKAPTYFVSKEFKKYDWCVKVEPQKPKGENEYDVIIIGSGIGGLTCGSLLSKRGYKVLVLEQHHQAGGYCSSFRRRGFIFNVGVENVSGLWEKGPVNYLLKELGLKKENLFVRNKERYIYKGNAIDVSQNLEEFPKLLSSMFPDEKESILSFFDEAKKAYDECYQDTEVYGVLLPPELLVKVFGARKLLNYPKEHPRFYDWLNKTYKQKLDEHFKSEDLKALLCALLPYVGTEPEKTSAARALTASVSYFLHGGYFTKGGGQNFANSLKSFIENHGGEVLVNHKVDKILAENGEVRGVKVGNKIFRSPIVVSNANARTTFLELIGKDNLGKGFIHYIKSLKMSPSCSMVFLGVKMDLSRYPTLFISLDDGYHMLINSNADPTLAPQGKAAVTIITFANYYDFPERGTKEYLQKKKKFAEMLIRRAEKILPNLSKQVIFRDAATPRTFERYTGMPEGAIHAFDQSIETRRPYFKTPIKGLYLVGASTFPGGGIEAVVISGMICSNDICNWKGCSEV